MMRILAVLVALAIVGAGVYALIKLHAILVVRWKNEIEEIDEHGLDKYLVGENLHDIVMLGGLTLVPVILDSLIGVLIYTAIKDMLT